MSTYADDRDSSQSAAAEPAQRAGNRGIPRMVFGALALLASLVLIGGAGAAIVGLETKRDATGYFVTHRHHYRTPSFALSTETLDLSGATGALEAGLVRLRIAVTSDEGKPLFVGIARADDANRYLETVAHDELRDIRFYPFKVDYRRSGTGAPLASPSAQAFWQMHASGNGTQTITWPVTRGRWTAVVMNADGSRNVSVDAQLAAQLAGAWALVAACVALGLVLLVAGIALVRSGARRRSPAAGARAA